MSLTFPLIAASIAAGSILAAFWMSPFDPTLEQMSERFDDIKSSVDNAKAGNRLTTALKKQATRLMDQYDDERDKIIDRKGANETRDKAQLLLVVRNATILKTLYENLLMSRDLHKIVSDSPLRVRGADGQPDADGNPVGVKGVHGIRAWVLGGMKADLDA